jgi:pimeloyl-ACP methyl ester carboxylesterase
MRHDRSGMLSSTVQLRARGIPAFEHVRAPARCPGPCSPFAALGALLAGALLLAACGPSPSDAEPEDRERDLGTDIDPKRFEAEASWQPCGRGLECRSIEVPVDHDAPEGAKLSLALTRAPAWQGHDRRGVILLNPGGPGAPGRPFLEAVDARRALGMLRGFDLISFDPRGVGDSGGIPCGTEAYPKVAFDSGGVEGLIEYYATDARACAERLGPLFDHLGSHDVVRDLELVRQALGEEQLNFLGASYGTRLAALYAQTFPERVRAFVLDGPVHPVADLSALIASQFEALVAAVDELIADCLDGVLDCPYDADFLIQDLWNRSVALNAEDSFAGLFKAALAQQTGREDLAAFLWDYLFFPELWDELVLLPSGETPPQIAVNQVVHCTDQSVAMPLAADIEARFSEFTERSPEFSVVTLPLATCAGWQVRPNPVEPLAATGAPPLLLIAGEHDILTPAVMAEELKSALAQSVLVRSSHYGHGAVLVGLPCIDTMLENFFELQQLPEDGATCD